MTSPYSSSAYQCAARGSRGGDETVFVCCLSMSECIPTSYALLDLLHDIHFLWRSLWERSGDPGLSAGAVWILRAASAMPRNLRTPSAVGRQPLVTTSCANCAGQRHAEIRRHLRSLKRLCNHEQSELKPYQNAVPGWEMFLPPGDRCSIPPY